MVDELFCPECGMLRRRCVCKKRTIREKNMELLHKTGYREMLEPIFNCDDEIVFYRIFRPFNEEPTEPLDVQENLSEVLRAKGISKLFEFQKKAIDCLRRGKNVVITAPTGFGKTEAFAIPLIEKVAEGGRGIVFYPTKALARDQEVKIRDYASALGLKAVRFDGDSDLTSRRAVLGGKADIVLTNPDMVDYHLRNTPAFRNFCRDVVFVAVDELHVYTGILGSNMHYLVKRLSRFSDFQIACTSATLSNAKEFAEELFDREFIHVSGEHRKSTLYFIARYTPSIYSTIRDIVLSLRNRKIIVFGNSYKSVETINLVLRRSGVKSAIHKSGLPKEVRKSVEERFRNGEINVVVATPTLELGIDIGDVDVVVSELVPYSQMQQRIGRAGRKGQESVGVVVLREEDSISTYYRSNPEEYFRDEASGYVEKMNEEVMKYQILSMCIERPLSVDEVNSNSNPNPNSNPNSNSNSNQNPNQNQYLQILKELVGEGLVVERDGIYFATQLGIEHARNFSMRGIGETVRMYCNGELVGERALPIAVKELFPGSIVLHNGIRYRSKELDLKGLKAELVEIGDGDEITDPVYTTIPRVVDAVAEISEPVNAFYCKLEITNIVHGYIERNLFEKDRKSIGYLDEPVSYTFKTMGFVFSAPFPALIPASEPEYEDYYAGSFHALEHVLIETTDAITGGGSREMGGISVPEGDIFVYDAAPGGSGLSKLLFRRLGKAFEIAYSILKDCECKRVDGCPRCTYSYQCGNNNQPLNRIGALSIAEKVLKKEGIRRTDWKKYAGVAEFRYFP